MDYLKLSDRKQIIDEINSNEENLRRKEESLMAYEIYKSRMNPFLLEKISRELGSEAARKSRVISSINLSKKIVNEQAQVYKAEPERTFQGSLNENQIEHLNKIYEMGNANVKLKKLNRIYKLRDQAALQIVPKDGKIEFRPLYPHHYDVVPKYNDPEKADAYIISSFNKQRLLSSLPRQSGSAWYLDRSYFADSSNQKIGEPDDYKTRQVYYWWTEKYNFITNHNGEIVDENGVVLLGVREQDILNPIECLPFVDVALDKDFEFFVRAGNTVTDFSLEFGLMLSDTSEINRLQGFSQAILASTEAPRNLEVGPRKVLWLKLDPKDTEATRPSFAFESPSPDLNASLQLLSQTASLFLTSVGQSPTLVNANGTQEKYTSGLDRFLAMVEKFDQSQDDLDLFRHVEMKAFELVKKWNNIYYNSTDNGFIPELSGVSIPEDASLSIKFGKPQMLMSEIEKLNLIEKKRELGLISEIESIMLDRGINEEEAIKIRQEISKTNI